jgi:uncharacterized membrane protein
METQTYLLVKAFDQEKKAKEVLKELKHLQKDGTIHIANAATLSKDAHSETHIAETEDVDAAHGAVFGAIIGGLVGLLGGPVGVVIGATVGLGTGTVAAEFTDSGFNDEYLAELAETLKPSSSAIVALVEHTWVAKVREALGHYEGNLVEQEIKDEILAQLKAQAEPKPAEAPKE